MQEGSQFGKYQIIKHLASGGMAEIYLAKTFNTDDTDRHLVLKVIHADKSEDQALVDMLQDEAKIAHEFDHKNICKVFDFGEIDGIHYIAMEFINGKDLHQILTRCSERDVSMPFDVLTFITLEAAKGLYAAHTKCDANGQPLNVIHRDVSPQNILVSYDGDIKIIDFGIAKANQRSCDETECGILKGKFNYMSPEQTWSSSDIDARSDIFSLGICLYEMICGEMLFNEEKILMLLDMIRKAEIPSIRKRRKDVPDQLELIALKALARDRDDRFPTADAMQSALTKFLYSQWPDFTPERVKLFMAQLFGDQAALITEVTSPGHLTPKKAAKRNLIFLEAPDTETETEEEGDRTVLASDLNSQLFDSPESGTIISDSHEQGIDWDDLAPNPNDDEDATSVVKSEHYQDLRITLENMPAAQSVDRMLPSQPSLTPPANIKSQQPLQAIPLTVTKKTVPLRPQSVSQAIRAQQQSAIIMAQNSNVAHMYPAGDESVKNRPTPPSWQASSVNLAPISAPTLNPPVQVPAPLYAHNNLPTLQRMPVVQKRSSIARNLFLGVLLFVAVAVSAYFLTHQAAPNSPVSSVQMDLISNPPGAQIFFNGQPLGQATPARLDHLQPGSTIQLRFERKGYLPYETTITLTPAGGPQNLPMIQMVPAPGKLRIVSQPPGAEIEITNFRNIVGQVTPFETTIERKDSAVILKLDGYQTQKREIIWGDETELEISIEMPARPTPPSKSKR